MAVLRLAVKRVPAMPTRANATIRELFRYSMALLADVPQSALAQRGTESSRRQPAVAERARPSQFQPAQPDLDAVDWVLGQRPVVGKQTQVRVGLFALVEDAASEAGGNSRVKLMPTHICGDVISTCTLTFCQSGSS